MKKTVLLLILVVIFAACEKEATMPEKEGKEKVIIPKISWSWDNPGELRALCVYLEFQKDATTTKEVEELWHNAARIMIPYKGIIKMLKCNYSPSQAETEELIQTLQNDSEYCDFTELKPGIDYFLTRGRVVCVDLHEFVGYFQYTTTSEEEKDASLFADDYKQTLLREFELQLAQFLQKNYAVQVKAGNLCLELLNEPKNDLWESIQLSLAQEISQKFPELCLAVRPNQSYSADCLRATWFEPADYQGIRHLTFINFWFMERPDLGASPVDFTIQYDKFVQKRNGEEVTFNVFGGEAVGFYSGKKYHLSKELLKTEFELCRDWAKKNKENIFFAELGCIRYADPQGQYFLSCLKFGQDQGIGIALFEVGAQYFFDFQGDVPYYLNDPDWDGFKYLQMSPEEIETQ